MAFTVYPSPQAKPLPLPKAPSAAVLTAFTQRAAPEPTLNPPYVKVMYLRVALSGTTLAPTLQLQAGAGPAVPLNDQSNPVLRGPNPVTDYVGDAWIVVEGAHVTQVWVGFHADTTETWQLGITNTDAATDAHRYGTIAAWQ